ncbi:MAG: hypothetical protein PVG07_15015 [Acidobacteriota bacterium]|jgi:hypothetical protein
MPIESFLNLNLLRAYGGHVMNERAVAAVEEANEIFKDALMAAYRSPPREGRAEEVLQRLVVAADELRGLGAWMASHAFPVVELVGNETEEDLLYAFREDQGRRFGQYLLALAARFQESFHPTRREVRAWRESFPEHVPYWNLGAPLRYPPPVLPPARDRDQLILSSVERDLAQLGELLEQAARHYAWMLEDLPEPAGAREAPLNRLARELHALRARLAALARDARELVAGEVPAEDAGDDAGGDVRDDET